MQPITSSALCIPQQGQQQDDEQQQIQKIHRVGHIKPEMNSLSTFNPILGNPNWNVSNHHLHPTQFHQNFPSPQTDHQLFPQTTRSLPDNLLLHPMDSSSLVLGLDPTQSQPFFPPKPYLSSLLSAVELACNYSLDNPFELFCDPGFVEPPIHENQASNSPVFINRAQGGLVEFNGLNPLPETVEFDLGSGSMTHLLQNSGGAAIDGGFSALGSQSFDGYRDPSFLNRDNGLRPLETLPASGSQIPPVVDRDKGKRPVEEEQGMLWKEHNTGEGEMDEIDSSSLISDSDIQTEDYKVEGDANNGGDNSKDNTSVITGNKKDKKKGLPAKNLMAERRRRKKVNDRLYMLRSVVPRISKMDRASILADAIEYLNELLQRIKDLNDERQSTPPGSSLQSSASFLPSTPTAPTPPYYIKEEHNGNSLPSPNYQQPRIHVEVREGNEFNIHMFCTRRPGLLLSTMMALDNLGLDVQQAVISCFNGFVMDVFKAEVSFLSHCICARDNQGLYQYSLF
ncbi:unnamed protein product [Ilex paraguariensis]|uniref:BHLH domain-containing protein n=1 Tax=Ilex paraguariensis TaxID=185542 RepID=A0ABC8UDZ9_9AQUA